MPIISQNVRIRYPEHFRVGEWVIIDDFCYFSTQVQIADFAHIAPGVNVSGGPLRVFRMEDFTGVAAGASIHCTSGDYSNEIAGIFPPWLLADGDLRQHYYEGDVVLEKYSLVGVNAVVMPDNVLPIGSVVGALSYVPPSATLKPWTVYAGIPVRPVNRRNQDRVLEQAAEIQRRIDRHKERLRRAQG
jgi:acetyltransferase-like isoleucine patch superfamily enzyme